jgi:hypothetical protein
MTEQEIKELADDVEAINACADCNCFRSLNRVFQEHRKRLYKQLAEGDAGDEIAMKVSQGLIKLAEDLLSTPANLQKKIDKLRESGYRREERKNKLKSIFDKKRAAIDV